MIPEKRGRSRPPGEGKPDGKHLEKVADLLVQYQLAPKTAIKRIVDQRSDWGPSSTSSVVRRLERKWAKTGAMHLAAARQRRAAAATSRTYSIPHLCEAISAIRTAPVLQDLGDAIRNFQNTINSPGFVRQWNEAVEAFKAFQGSPAAKWIAEHSKNNRL